MQRHGIKKRWQSNLSLKKKRVRFFLTQHLRKTCFERKVVEIRIRRSKLFFFWEMATSQYLWIFVQVSFFKFNLILGYSFDYIDWLWHCKIIWKLILVLYVNWNSFSLMLFSKISDRLISYLFKWVCDAPLLGISKIFFF